MPATRHDLYALKPTLGLISQEGVCPISWDFDLIGPIAKSAEDIAVLMDVLVDPKRSANVPKGGYVPHLTKSFDGIRIGVLKPSEWHMPPVVVFPNAEADAQSVILDLLRRVSGEKTFELTDNLTGPRDLGCVSEVEGHWCRGQGSRNREP